MKRLEKAREKRMKGRRVIVTNRRMWIKGQEWRWDEGERVWRRR